ncbi:MAG: hypothetical protein ABI601_06235 [bacterium]
MALTEREVKGKLAELQQIADSRAGYPGPALAARVEEILAFLRALPQEDLLMSVDRLSQAFDSIFGTALYGPPEKGDWQAIVHRECARILVRLRTDPNGNVI